MRFLTTMIAALFGGTALQTPTATVLAKGDPATKATLAKRVGDSVDQDEERLVKTFKQLHTNPELGFQEVKTAELVAKEFKALGYETHTKIGKTGVVGILKNGPGPVVMFRGDMDGLPAWITRAKQPPPRMVAGSCP